jgi:hypothetical protein
MTTEAGLAMTKRDFPALCAADTVLEQHLTVASLRFPLPPKP